MPFASFIERTFPPPEFLAQHAVGVDISDSSVKWIQLQREQTWLRVASHGSLQVPAGIVESGVIKDVSALSKVLAGLQNNLAGLKTAHVALPEEPAYLFDMHVPSQTSREEILRLIEFEFEGRVPIAPAAAVYDFDIIDGSARNDGYIHISVQVFPRDLAQSYVDAFYSAGITPLSLEVEARSFARAISRPEDSVVLIIDFGRKRTGFAVLERGLPIFTSTVDVGGDQLMAVLQRSASLSEEEAVRLKNIQGLRSVFSRARNVPEDEKISIEAIVGVASSLADEVVRHYRFWDKRSDATGQKKSVDRIILAGGNSNIAGLTDYIARRVHATVERAQVWHNVASYDDYIPPIEQRESLQYATAIGLALRGRNI